MANKRQRKKTAQKQAVKLTKKERLIKHYEGITGVAKPKKERFFPWSDFYTEKA